jgi:soluble lytic murein transglycosylase
MGALRTVVLVLSALVIDAGIAAPSSRAGDMSDSLPPGLTRQGDVIMMQPIGDSAEAAPAQPFGERTPGLVHYLDPADHDLYTRAFEAAAQGDWTDARTSAAQGQDSVAGKIIEWRYLLDRNSGASFGEISEFLKNNPDWPDRDTLLARAENAIDPLMEPHAVVAWFGDREPATGIGKIRLGEALTSIGSADRGAELIRKGWIDGIFEPSQELAIIQRDGTVLTPDVDRERLMHLLLRGDIGDARQELSRLSAEDQLVAETALALRTSPAAGERMLDQLSQSSLDDPLVIFDRTKLLRQQNAISAIPDLIVRAPTREMAKIDPTRWWGELNLDARDALSLGDDNGAYMLAANTGLEPGTNEYSDAQFLAGWIALHWMHEPSIALLHFRKLAESVARPISVARAHFWEGRAYEAAGELARAWQEYRAAADNADTFYGQIALSRIDSAPQLHLSETTSDTASLQTAYEREELTHAIHVLGDLGLEGVLRVFAVHDADAYPDAGHIALLARDLTAMGFRDVAVRVAKEASYKGVRLFSYSHPVISVPAYSGSGLPPEPAFVLGIIRQETEFDPNAVSGTGARGIMQLMPESARRDAQLAGTEYRPEALTGDISYNMQLGMTELSSDLTEWGGSYVLAAAAYNAGPSNVRRWIASFGDPRDARIDPIDWIEQIPFGETRNYVQRVIENMEIYRNRLSGRDEPLRILTDLYRPNAPQIGPLAFAPPATAAVRAETPLTQAGIDGGR